MAIIFNQRLEFFPGVSVSIPGAEDYFIACGWATETNEEPLATYEGVEFDSQTRHADTGKLVLGSN